MTVGVQEIIAGVRRRIRQTDPEDSAWTDDDLLTYIRDALLVVAREVGFGRQSVTYLGNGDPSYPLPADCIAVERITDQGTVLAWSLMAEGAPDSPTNNWGNLIQGDRIYFMPTLGEGSSRTLHYYGIPLDPDNENDTVMMPTFARLAVIYKVAADCFFELGQSGQADKMEALHAFELRRARQAEKDRQFPTRSLRVPRAVR